MFPLHPRQSTVKISISPLLPGFTQSPGEFWSTMPRRQVSVFWGTSAHPDLRHCGLRRAWWVPEWEDLPPRRAYPGSVCCPQARQGRVGQGGVGQGESVQAAVRGAEPGSTLGCGTLCFAGGSGPSIPAWLGSCHGEVREGKGVLQRRLNCSCKLDAAGEEERCLKEGKSLFPLLHTPSSGDKSMHKKTSWAESIWVQTGSFPCIPISRPQPWHKQQMHNVSYSSYTWTCMWKP